MKKFGMILLGGAATICLFAPALAQEAMNGQTISIEQASKLLYYSGGNDRFRVEIAPNYSEDLGWSVKGAAGGFLTDSMALGLIVEYGENKREYLANAGIQFNDAVSLVGTIGMLEEHIEFFEEDGREAVQQMEYGISLKSNWEAGLLTGLELNAYLADADSDYEFADVGKLYGLQLMANMDLTSTTHVSLGGGYEWLAWDGADGMEESWTFSADAVQSLTDALSVTAHAKLGVSEFVYGGGLALDLSNGGPNTNVVELKYSYIDGREGIDSDQRIELGWTLGFGAGPTTSVADAGMKDGNGSIQAAADVVAPSSSSTLLSEVMKRPSFLPQRVLARGTESESTDNACLAQFLENPEAFEAVEVGVWYVSSGDDGTPGPLTGDDMIDMDTEDDLGVGTFTLYLSQDPHSPTNLTVLATNVNVKPGVHSVLPVQDGMLNWDGTWYEYNESIWTVIEEEGSCKAIFWGED